MAGGVLWYSAGDMGGASSQTSAEARGVDYGSCEPGGSESPTTASNRFMEILMGKNRKGWEKVLATSVFFAVPLLISAGGGGEFAHLYAAAGLAEALIFVIALAAQRRQSRFTT